MNDILRQIARAMYQIIVVGIILFPLRLAFGIIGLLYGLMTITKCPGALKAYYSAFFTGLYLAYVQRAHWVKYGCNLPDDIKQEEAAM